MITIYTDGACSKNGYAGSSGGYGVVVLQDGKPVEFRSKKCEGETTNNREELKAILYSMLKYGSRDNPPMIYSDSAYSIQTLSQWMYGWARNGWLKKSDNKVPENLDLIKPFYDRCEEGYKVSFTKVAGHAGIKWNEIADRLATGELTETKAWELYG